MAAVRARMTAERRMANFPMLNAPNGPSLPKAFDKPGKEDELRLRGLVSLFNTDAMGLGE